MFCWQEYIRSAVEVHPLSEMVSLSSSSDHFAQLLQAAPLSDKLAPAVPAETYIWSASLNQLEPELWSYEVFVKEKLQNWVGDSSTSNEDYEKVDERREMNGTIVRAGV